jgi:hypothetical protein
VVRYNNRLLQLERQSRRCAPAKSRVLVRENRSGEVAIHYRDQRVGFRELKASAALDERRSAAPSPAPLSPILRRSLPAAANHPWRKRIFRQSKRWLFQRRVKPKPGDISIVV